MKCKNQYGWQEVLTCKQRWMTGSSRSWNPRWLNFLWSYFRQAELSVKFKVKYQTSDSTTVSINVWTLIHALQMLNLKGFFLLFSVIKCHTVLQTMWPWPCASQESVWVHRSSWAAGHGLWTMCFLTWAEHVDSLLGIVDTHCHTHIGYFSW